MPVHGRRVLVSHRGCFYYGKKMQLDSNLNKELAPRGRMTASINLGNPILANRAPNTGLPVGVSIDLAQAFAAELALELDLLVFDTAAQSVQAVKSEAADFGFFAIDPARGQDIAFTQAYILIEGAYVVRSGSPISRNDDVDDSRNRVAVGAGSAYDLFLTRTLKHAQIERAGSSADVLATFNTKQLEVAAGIRPVLQAEVAQLPGLRLLPGRFMVIEQAMGLPKNRGANAHAALADFVERMKSSGFVAEALRRHGIDGATVAP